MARFGRLEAPCLAILEVILTLLLQVIGGRFEECSLISLERQDVVAFPVHDLFRDRRLGPHCVDGHDRALQVDERQSLGNCRDFVGFRVCRHLRQCQAKLTGPDTHGVQGAQLFLGARKGVRTFLGVFRGGEGLTGGSGAARLPAPNSHLQRASPD